MRLIKNCAIDCLIMIVCVGFPLANGVFELCLVFSGMMVQDPKKAKDVGSTTTTR